MKETIQNQKTTLPSNLPHPVQELNNCLTLIKPNDSETTQLITYVLVGTVVAGLLVYQYIKSQDQRTATLDKVGEQNG